MFKFAILIALATISSCPGSISAAAVGYPEEIVEEPQVYVGPQFRDKRSPQLSGGGSEKSGSIRYDGQKTVWSNGKTGVDATGFAQHSWQKGYPSQTSYGAGATVNHNLYKGRHGELDAYAGYQRQWNTPSRDNYNAGLRYRF